MKPKEDRLLLLNHANAVYASRQRKTRKFVTIQHMTPTLPLGHEPFGPERKAEGLETEWRFGVIHERNVVLSMEMSFFDSVPGPDLAHTA
jgi:hypothetical protein